MRKSELKQKCALVVSAFLMTFSLAHSQSQYYNYDYDQSNQAPYGYSNQHNYYGSDQYSNNNGYNGNYYNNYNNGYDDYNQAHENYYRPQAGDYDNRNSARKYDPVQYRMQNGQLMRVPNATNWGFQESWRDNKKAFYHGETQAQAYRQNHPYGEGGIGYDPDPVYLRMEEEYRQSAEQQRQGGGGNRSDNYYSGQDNNSSRVKAKTKGNFYRQGNYNQ